MCRKLSDRHFKMELPVQSSAGAMSTARQFSMFDENILSDADIEKNIKCNVMMTEGREEKDLFSLNNSDTSEKKDTFGAEDYGSSLLMVNENSLETFVDSKLNVMISGKDSNSESDILERGADALGIMDVGLESQQDSSQHLGIDLLGDNSSSGRGTPAIFRKFDISDGKFCSGTNNDTLKYEMAHLGSDVQSFGEESSQLSQSNDSSDMRIIEQNNPVIIEPDYFESAKSFSTQSDKTKTIKKEGRPVINIQSNTSNFVINLNASQVVASSSKTPKQKMDAPKPLVASKSIPTKLTSLRIRHPIISGLLGIPPKGTIWQVPNLFGPGLTNNQPYITLSASLKRKGSVDETSIKKQKTLNTELNGSLNLRIDATQDPVYPSAKEIIAQLIQNSKNALKNDIHSKKQKDDICAQSTSGSRRISKEMSTPLPKRKKSEEEALSDENVHSVTSAKDASLQKPGQNSFNDLLGTADLSKFPSVTSASSDDDPLAAHAIEIEDSEDESYEEDTRPNHKTLGQTLVDQYMKNWKPTGRYTCTDCPYSSVTRNYLFRHWVMRHNVVKPYSCPYCQLSIGYKDGITRHQASVHRGRPKNVVIDYEMEAQLMIAFRKQFDHILDDDTSFGPAPIPPLSLESALALAYAPDIIPTSLPSSVSNTPAEISSAAESLSSVPVSSQLPILPNPEKLAGIISMAVSKAAVSKTSVKATTTVTSSSSSSLSNSTKMPSTPVAIGLETLLPRMKSNNEHSIPISAAIALQSAVLSLTQASQRHSKFQNVCNSTTCGEKKLDKLAGVTKKDSSLRQVKTEERAKNVTENERNALPPFVQVKNWHHTVTRQTDTLNTTTDSKVS